MKLTDEWFTAVSESDAGELIFVSGREELTAFRESGKFKERAEVSWKYAGNVQGMPSDADATAMEAVQEALKRKIEKDKLAVLTGVYTGGGERTWVFYTRNVPAFGVALNEALEPFDLLPLTVYTEKDPDWNEYREMLELVG